MKRLLLLLPFLCLMPAAQAVDYVKCEAMQKAMARVRSKGDLARKDAGYAWEKEISAEFCGPRPPWTGSLTKETRAYVNCSESAQKKLMKAGDKRRAMNAAYAEATKDLTKIQADYDAEGCY